MAGNDLTSCHSLFSYKIFCYYFVTFILFANFAFLNSFLYAFSLFFGTLIFAALLMPLNAFLPIFFNDLDLTMIFFIFLHPAKAFFPIVVIPVPIVIFFSFLHPLNAFGAMSVTLYVMPVTSTSAMVIKSAYSLHGANPANRRFR